MDNVKYELEALRDLREINLAIRDLENHQAAVAKRFRRGVRMLMKESNSSEHEMEKGEGLFVGTEPWVTRSKALTLLIADPVLTNIPEDTSV